MLYTVGQYGFSWEGGGGYQLFVPHSPSGKPPDNIRVVSSPTFSGLVYRGLHDTLRKTYAEQVSGVATLLSVAVGATLFSESYEYGQVDKHHASRCGMDLSQFPALRCGKLEESTDDWRRIWTPALSGFAMSSSCALWRTPDKLYVVGCRASPRDQWRVHHSPSQRIVIELIGEWCTHVVGLHVLRAPLVCLDLYRLMHVLDFWDPLGSGKVVWNGLR